MNYFKINLTVAFLLSWSPYAVLAMYVIITKNSTMHLALSSVPVVLAKTAPLWNPYIYFVRDRRFNKECEKLLPIFKKLGIFESHRTEQHEWHQMGDTSSTNVPLCEHEKQKTVADLQKARTFWDSPPRNNMNRTPWGIHPRRMYLCANGEQKKNTVNLLFGACFWLL